MNTKGLNEYLKNYLINDKTKRAVMLTGPWGSGKSYYIKHELCPFLLENKLDYAVVSVYGIKELKDINKSLYLEIRTKKLKTIKFVDKASKKIAKNNSEEVKSSGKIIGKTIVKGIASFFNVNLDLSDKDLEKLYASVNLKDKLIIFEDVERSGIDLIEFLGYVNNIVETDGIKVLLVTNESELIKYEKAKDDKKSDYTEETKRYLKIKEKTVGDTIQFVGNSYEIIESIYRNFNNESFKKLKNEIYSESKFNIIEKIESVMKEQTSFNYRAIIYGLQKTSDIFDKIDFISSYNLEFLENVLLGTIAFAIKYNLNDQLRWGNNFFSSPDLGSYRYPLYKFVFDYIKFQNFDIENVQFAQQLFLNAKEHSKTDNYLKTIYSYYISSEEKVKDAIAHVHKSLESNKGLDVSEYITLANYLISIRSILKCDEEVEECLSLMLKNAQIVLNNGGKIDMFVTSGINLENEPDRQKFAEFKSQMQNLSKKEGSILNFDYTIKHLEQFCDTCLQETKNRIFENGFADQLNIEKMMDLITKCSSSQISDLRNLFLSIYNFSNIDEYYQRDINNLTKLKDKLMEFIQDQKGMDAIKKKQIEWFVGNLQSIIEDLSGGKDGI